MKHSLIIIIAAALLTALCAPAWAINKCIGPDGKVAFQDAACDATSTTARDDLVNAKKDAEIKRDAVRKSLKTVAQDLEAQLSSELKNRANRPPPMTEPAPAATVSSTAADMTFDQCTASVQSTIKSLAINWKDVKRIVNSAQVTITKICTHDGSVTITCSAPDSRMVTTRGDRCDT